MVKAKRPNRSLGRVMVMLRSDGEAGIPRTRLREDAGIATRGRESESDLLHHQLQRANLPALFCVFSGVVDYIQTNYPCPN